MKVRLATRVDVGAMLALERASPSSAHWTENQYVELFESGGEAAKRLVLIAESSPSTAENEVSSGVSPVGGFLVARRVASEWELENIVVAATLRRKGVGKQLLEELLNAARRAESDSVLLEVRESNVAARGLYEKLGFRQTGRRPGYYVNPAGVDASEDAILYGRDLA